MPGPGPCGRTTSGYETHGTPVVLYLENPWYRVHNGYDRPGRALAKKVANTQQASPGAARDAAGGARRAARRVLRAWATPPAPRRARCVCRGQARKPGGGRAPRAVQSSPSTASAVAIGGGRAAPRPPAPGSFSHGRCQAVEAAVSAVPDVVPLNKDSQRDVIAAVSMRPSGLGAASCPAPRHFCAGLGALSACCDVLPARQVPCVFNVIVLKGKCLPKGRDGSHDSCVDLTLRVSPHMLPCSSCTARCRD